ncbi:hypothetical protein FPV67DRAFT_1482109 [Lyophyllum atratum]|nr:hypothetical protein FPV67DRAFT_1482109 [Lyophyllum atratum]
MRSPNCRNAPKLYALSMSYIPQEIIHLIIDPFRGDLHTLARCSTVCRSWSHRCRALLFQNVTINCESPAAEYQIISLHKCLSRNHDLADLIRSFEVQHFRWMSTSDLADSTLQVLGKILQSLHHVQQLSLRGVRWYSFPHHLQLAFSGLLKCPSVEELYLEQFVVSNQLTLLSFITCLPNLKALHLKDIAVRDVQPRPTMLRWIYLAITRQLNNDIDSRTCLIQDARHEGCLERLHIANRGDLFPIADCLLHPEFSHRLRTIHSLDIFDRTRPELVKRLLKITSSSLEHLKISSSDRYWSETDLAGAEVYLKNLPCLRTLELSKRMPLCGIVRVLSDLGSSTHPLEKIRLSHGHRHGGWGIVDDCLTQSALGSLRRVELVLHGTWLNHGIEVTSKLPKLRARGVLVICRT